METPMRCLRVYKELAGWYEERGQAPMRDRFLVLAAFAAQDVGREDEAEGLRHRLLRGNPHHMLKPYSSVRQALLAEDVQAYLQALQTNYPCETAEELLRKLRTGEEARQTPRRKGEGSAMPTMKPQVLPTLSVPLPSPAEEQDVTATLPLGQAVPKLLGNPPARKEPGKRPPEEQDVTATLPLGQAPLRPRPAPVVRKEPQQDVPPLRPTELPRGHEAPPPAEEVRPMAAPQLPDTDDALPERSRGGDLTPTAFPDGLPPTMPPGAAPPLPPGVAPRPPVRRGAAAQPVPGGALPRGATPPPTAAIPIVRPHAPPPPAAEPRPSPSPFLPLRPEPARPAEEPATEGEYTAGSWLGASLCGIVLTAAMLLVGYTLARPFLPPEWLP
jgi:hypothetical protein